MPTECSPDSLDFASLGSRKVTAAFDGGAITSNAGALLLRETDRGIGLSRQAAACFTDGRRQDRIEHSVETLIAQRIHGIALGYEDLNRIKECQLDLFADRTSAANLRANQLRLWFASLAYVLLTALRRIALQGTELAQATAGTIRLKLLKLGALVTTSVRRVKIAIASACPMKSVFFTAHRRLCPIA